MDLHCHNCGSSVPDHPIAKGQILRCGLCKNVLKKYRAPGSYESACALALCALVLLGLANAYPIMNFSVAGNVQSNEIITGIAVLIRQGYWPISLLVFICALLAPAVYFLAVAYASASCSCDKPFPLSAQAAKLAEIAQPWSLLPVFAAACMVSAVKLKLIGTVDWQPGVWLIVLLAINALLLTGLLDADDALRIFEKNRLLFARHAQETQGAQAGGERK